MRQDFGMRVFQQDIILKWYFLLIDQSSQLYILNMKYLQQNNRLLETILNKMSQEMKRNLKFSKHRISEEQMVRLCVDYLRQQNRMMANQLKKENVSPNTSNREGGGSTSGKQNGSSRQQIESQLSRRYNMFLSKEFTPEESPNKAEQEEHWNLEEQFPDVTTSLTKQQNWIPNIPLTSSYTISPTPTSQSPSYTLVGSRNHQKIKRTHHLLSTKGGQSEASFTKSSKQKSKTFSQLRKVEEIFCSQNLSRQNSKKKRCVIEYVEQIKDNTDKQAILQQNKCLKAIQNNLITHLTLLQKYKHVPSLEQLVKRQQTLKRKQQSTKQLEQSLTKRQMMLNKSHYQVLKKQRSLKMV